MSSAIVLSAGVRQNLLALQNTAALESTVQNRLATGKKVNSALDNPSSYFTSQALQSRASELNSLLDQIGQAQETIQAANNGLTSLTTLLQSAKSIATQAQQATGPVDTYSGVSATANISGATNLAGTESIATVTGTANLESTGPIAISKTTLSETLGQETGSVAFANDAAVVSALPSGSPGANDGTVQITASDRNGTTYTWNVAIAGSSITTKAQLLAAFNSATSTSGGQTLSNFVTAGYSSGNDLQLTADKSSTNFTISAGGSGSTAATLTALGLTANSYNSTSLLGQLGGNAQGKTLVVAGVNADQSTFSDTITFGTGAGQVETLSDLNTALGGFSSDFSGSVGTVTTGNSIAGSLSIGKGASQYSEITLSGSSGVEAALSNNGSAGNLFKTYDSVPTLQDLGTGLSQGGSLSISVNGIAYTVGIGANDRASDIVNDLKGNGSLSAALNFSVITDASNHQHIQITAKDSTSDITVNANATSAALGLTTDSSTSNSVNGTSLLDLLGAKLAGASYSSANNASYRSTAEGTTLTVAVNGGSTQTITFGTGTGEIQTFAELQTAVQSLSNATGSLNSSGALSIQVASGSSQTSLTLGGTAASALGLGSYGTQSGSVTSETLSSTRATLQANYNDLLTQIDQLANDSSYNGINLLKGDDLKITFDETGASSETIKGSTLNSNGLGLFQLNANQFQSNSSIDTVTAAITNALTTVQTTASTLGSTLSTVQTRQDFTKDLVTTLQTGADNLVVADTNLEGANLLALQTRQSLSTTALSLANQQNQAVLRLFG